MKSPAQYRRRTTKTAKVIPSRELREIKAAMAMKHLDLADVARRAGVNYGVASCVLSGRIVRPQHVAKLRAAVASSPTP
jgi:hypothetical protein